jgi:hypothetical protein
MNQWKIYLTESRVLFSLIWYLLLYRLTLLTDAVLELVITIEDEGIPAREFAEYLALLDRIYGRMDRDGLMSYAHREWGRLRIAEVNKGSLEAVFRFAQEHAEKAIIIYLFLKSLPNVIKVSAEAFKTYQEGRSIREDTRHNEIIHRHEESRLARENKRRIKDMIQKEPSSASLDDERKSQLTRLLDALIMEGNPCLPAPIKFARNQVKNVILRIKGQNQPT